MIQPLVPFGDLKRQHASLQAELQAVITHVLASGWYILGAELDAFEQEFAAYCGVQHGIGVASGADALYLALAALDVGAGSEVITVANACSYQVAAILQTGARPVLVDVDPETHTIDPESIEAAITPSTRAILPVHLYGRLADMVSIMDLAAHYHLAVVEDAAQAHGAYRLDAAGKQRRAGAWGTLACFSFYPTKNLGALGDGGAVVTSDPALAERIKRLRQYGWQHKYLSIEPGGRNSRLDELQAAILRLKLRYLDVWNAARRERAAWYASLLSAASVRLPLDAPGHVYHLYVIESDQRDALRQYLIEQGIGCDVHYPYPAHLQPAYAHLAYQSGTLPQTERLARCILSLPLYPELTLAEVKQVATAVQDYSGGLRRSI